MTNGTDDSPSRLANFLTPTSLDRFLSEYYDNVPLHVSADDAASDRQELMDSATVSALLRNTVHWPENGLKLVANGQSIASAHYHSLRELRPAIPLRAAFTRQQAPWSWTASSGAMEMPPS